MAEEEAEDQKVRENARIALDRVSSDDEVIVFVCVCVCVYTWLENKLRKVKRFC